MDFVKRDYGTAEVFEVSQVEVWGGLQVYKEDKRLIPKSQVLRVISIFHNLPIAAHQSKDAVWEQVK